VIFGKTRGHTRAPVVTDQGNLADAELVEQSDQVLRHIVLVVARCRLVGFTIAPKVRRDDAKFLRENRDLKTPRKAGSGETME
jgi:hypothetical protein